MDDACGCYLERQKDYDDIKIICCSSHKAATWSLKHKRFGLSNWYISIGIAAKKGTNRRVRLALSLDKYKIVLIIGEEN